MRRQVITKAKWMEITGSNSVETENGLKIHQKRIL